MSDHRANPVRKLELIADDPGGERLRLIILTADFTLETFADHEGFFGWLAQGQAYSNIRRMLVTETEREVARKRDGETVCVLWAMHFPPNYPGVKEHSRLLGEEQLIVEANKAGTHAILAGHTHKQLAYKYPSMSFMVYCCGTTTQHEPLTAPGGREERNVLKGNLFQIMTVTSGAAGRPALTVQDFRYTGSEDWTSSKLMRWEEVGRC